MDIVTQLHFYNLYLILIASLVAGVWGLVLFFAKKPFLRSWRNLLIVTGALALLQGILGVTLLLMGKKPDAGVGLYYLHYVYGGIVALALPVALTYATSGKNPRRDILIFSLAALVLFAAGFRAWMNGPGYWPSWQPS